MIIFDDPDRRPLRNPAHIRLRLIHEDGTIRTYDHDEHEDGVYTFRLRKGDRVSQWSPPWHEDALNPDQNPEEEDLPGNPFPELPQDVNMRLLDYQPCPGGSGTYHEVYRCTDGTLLGTVDADLFNPVATGVYGCERHPLTRAEMKDIVAFMDDAYRRSLFAKTMQRLDEVGA